MKQRSNLLDLDHRARAVFVTDLTPPFHMHPPPSGVPSEQMIHTSHHVPGDIIRRVIQDVTSRHGIDDIRRHCPAQLALSEAARLAWRTDYPLLFFPLLAEEKLREVLAPEPSPPPLAAVEDGCLAHW